jgi:hypothetical protein
VAAWVHDEPTGHYARRTAFNVTHVDAIDAGLYLVAQRPERIRRWRVNNNLPGTPAS